MIERSIALYAVAAVAEIGGAYPMWQATKEARARCSRSPGHPSVTRR